MLVCGLQLYRYLPRKRFFLALFFCGLLGLLLIEILGPGVRARFDAEGLTDWAPI